MVSEENGQFENRLKTTAIWSLRRMDSFKADGNNSNMVSEENGQFENRLKTTAMWFLRRMDSFKTDGRQQQCSF